MSHRRRYVLTELIIATRGQFPRLTHAPSCPLDWCRCRRWQEICADRTDNCYEGPVPMTYPCPQSSSWLVQVPVVTPCPIFSPPPSHAVTLSPLPLPTVSHWHLHLHLHPLPVLSLHYCHPCHALDTPSISPPPSHCLSPSPSPSPQMQADPHPCPKLLASNLLLSQMTERFFSRGLHVMWVS